MVRLLGGAVTALVLFLAGAGTAHASQGLKSTTPLDNFVKHCVQFGGLAGGDGTSAGCLFAPEDRYAQLARLCAAGGGVLTVVPATEEGTTTLLECTRG